MHTLHLVFQKCPLLVCLSLGSDTPVASANNQGEKKNFRYVFVTPSCFILYNAVETVDSYVARLGHIQNPPGRQTARRGGLGLEAKPGYQRHGPG
jgi:hypothetical protein